MTYIYIVGILIWPLLWYLVDGFPLLRQQKLLWLPFIMCFVVLLGNVLLSLEHQGVGPLEVEEGLFHFLDKRSLNIINIISGLLVISAVIYSVADRRFPLYFLRYVAATYITLLGFMMPVYWIPTHRPEWLQVLRAVQTVPFTFGIFFAIGAILILLKDVMRWLVANEDGQ